MTGIPAEARDAVVYILWEREATLPLGDARALADRMLAAAAPYIAARACAEALNGAADQLDAGPQFSVPPQAVSEYLRRLAAAVPDPHRIPHRRPRERRTRLPGTQRPPDLPDPAERRNEG